ncbi:U-box domain-containing protein 26-like [Hordeum vulgare subsp. vulgare]|uniref:U-box domain-containing protein n=1 Tax=Hordeum vulgare subsp. vulgare TaxID=112509 RepID=A0A8I6YQJ2_HORVV|nr:U-box domain-containing protein 26-like [Hordeum vulgare subsp. vulgare]
MLIPEVLVCPISLDLMSDPVTLLPTGQTYDRPSIRRWLAAGHRTCPVTMRPLPHHTSGGSDQSALLAPNRTLKHLIDRWLLLADLALPTLRDNLLDVAAAAAPESAPTVAAVETLRIIRSLSPPGFCALLLRLVTLRRSDDVLAELALGCLLASPSARELADALHEEKKLPSSFAFLLRQGSPKVKTALCRLIHTVGAVAVDAVVALGRSEPVMVALAALVRDDTDGAASEAALRAMWSLSSSDQASREAAVAAGAVDALLSYISSGGSRRRSPSCAPWALALETLELVLVSVDAGRQAMYARPGATAVLVKMVFMVPSRQDRVGGGGSGSEHAMASLLVACRESAEARVDAINAGLLTRLLLLLQSQCSPRAKANAMALLKLLRAIWARH